jgi:hypothetical protein
MADGKVRQKERVPYIFDNVIGCEYKEKKGDYDANTLGLARSDVEKARQSVGQNKAIHKKLTVLLLCRDVNTTVLPFYGMPIDSLSGETATAQRIGVVPLGFDCIC